MFRILLCILFSTGLFNMLSAQEMTEASCSHARIQQFNNARVYARVNQNEALEDYDIKFYFLDIEADNQSTHVKGKVTIKAEILAESMTDFVVELIDELVVDSVLVEQTKVNFSHTSGLVTVNLPSPLAANEIVDVTFFYEGTPPSGGFFSGISNAKSPTWGNQITWTLSEPLNAKDWFSCKQVLEDKADSAYIFITVPDTLKAGSNGLLTNIEPLENNRLRFEWKTRYPIAYYLLSMTIGAYVEYNIYANPAGANPILIQNFVYDNPNTLPFFKDAIDDVAGMIELYSELFGLYPFHAEKYGHCMAPFGGGMEHQTMTSLGSFNFTLDAHELGHQWFGDHVTCKSWSDIWLNEGFARYTEYLAIEFLQSKQAADNWMAGVYANALTASSGSVYVPEELATDPNRIFNSTLTYNKGGALLHMIRNIVNDDDLFFNVLKNYQTAFGNGVATGEDFKNFLESETSIDFDDFFADWYYGEGYPSFIIEWNHFNDSLFVVQKQFTSHFSVDFFDVPMDYKIKFADGSESMIRLTPTESIDTLQLLMPNEVTQITVDPSNWLLKKILSFTKNTNLIGKYEEVVGIEDTLKEQFDIYPNPVKNKLVISTTQTDYTCQLMDMKGRVLLTNEHVIGGQEMSLEGYAEGIYVLRISSKGQVLALKIKID